MFDHFTFGAPAQTLYPQQEEREASPTDCSHPPPISDTKPTTVLGEASPLDGLLNQFAQSSLRPDEPMWSASTWNDKVVVDENEEPQQSLWNDSLPSPTFDDSEFSIEELSYVSTRRGMATIPFQPSSSSANTNPYADILRNGNMACRRLKRQMDAKMMGCEKHVRDISTLVEDMIESNSQCNLHNSTSTPTPQTSLPSSRLTLPPYTGEEILVDTTGSFPSEPDDDEGFGEMDEDPYVPDFDREALEIGGKDDEMTLRRASTPSGIRKYTVIKYRKSADVGSAVTPNGRPKVRCLPRMRKRKPRSVPE